MTAIDPSEDHPEAITLGLHDASPPHMVDAMAKDVELELGWGKLIFGQTFADAATLTEALRREVAGRRDICIYARESHVVVAGAPATPIDCASAMTTPKRAWLRRRSA
jgi:hypothetical protein